MKNVNPIVDDDIAEVVINQGYFDNSIIPLKCVITGSRAYGLNTSDSDYDFIGLHIMDSWYCFEHPNYQPKLQIIQSKFDSDLELLPIGSNKSYLSLDSFELWKFYSLYKSGAFQSYELLYGIPIHYDESIVQLSYLMKEGVTNKIYYSAKAITQKWLSSTNKTNKNTVHIIYRLLQSIYFLQNKEFNIYIDDMIDGPTIKEINSFVNQYKKEEIKKLDKLTNKKVIDEIEFLVNVLNDSKASTKVFDECPQKIDVAIRQYMIKMRGTLI